MKRSVWKELLRPHQWRMRPFGGHSWILTKSKCSLACVFPICQWTNTSIIKYEIKAPILRWKSEGGFAFITHTGISLWNLILISERLQNMNRGFCKLLCCWFLHRPFRAHLICAQVDELHSGGAAQCSVQHRDRWVTCFSEFCGVQKARLPWDTLPLRRH